MKVNGIDISHWQGTIDWNKVKAAGIQFAILKAGGSDNGCYTDSAFEQNYQGAKAAGIPVGAYYFVGKKCISAADGQADARRFIEILNGKQFEYPVYMDVEAQDPKDKAGITDACIGFCETMESAGYFVGVYASSNSGFKERVGDSRIQKYVHWVAQYAKECTYDGAVGIGTWQYSSNGMVDGISGNVDLDECYVDYPSKIKNAGRNGFSAAPPAPVQVMPSKTEKKNSGVPSKEEKWKGRTTANLNVRTWAGTENGTCRFGPLRVGTVVSVCDITKARDGADWYYICVNGKYGFVHSAYIAH